VLNCILPSFRFKKEDSHILIIINDYERGLDSTSYDNLREQMNVSRIMLDILLDGAISKGLIQPDIYRSIFFLEPKGRQYAIQHKLIQI
jgi:hypothetical protein